METLVIVGATIVFTAIVLVTIGLVFWSYSNSNDDDTDD